MSNPRKFSERIRFHEQKLAEETAAFEKIMLEVSSATKDKTVTNGLEEVAPNPNPQARGRSFRERGSSVGSVGPMRSDKRSGDRSPYSSGPYLSPPPPDTSWKRCNSDSALHQSTLHSSSAESSAHLRSPGSQRRAKVDNQQHDENRYLPESPDKRPKPCYDSPRVPGIHVFPSQQDPGVVPIAFGKNTGSLPDLTNLLTQLSQPINFPFDQDDTHLSSYHSNQSPLTTDGCSPQGSQGSQGTPSQSPSVLSPVSINSHTPPTRFSFTSSPPPDSPNQTTVITCDIVLPNHLNVPSYNRFQHPCKDFKVENSLGSGNSREDCHSSLEMQILDQSSIMNCGAGQMNNINMNPTVMYNNIPTSQHQTQQSCTVDGLSEINSSHLNMGNSQLNNNTNSLGSYRSQHSNRPSPQSSPGLGIQYESPLYCNSPQSPSSPSNSSASLNLQKHFEGFSMQDWNQLIQTLKESNSTAWMATQLQHDSPIGMDFPSNNTYLTQTDDDVNSKVASDLEYSDTSPLPSLQYTNQSCTTPINILNTKSVQDVPDIILTDYSYGNHQMNNRNDFVKDSNSTNMTFDNVNNFFDPMTLDQLEPLDYLGMIPEPNNDALINSDNF